MSGVPIIRNASDFTLREQYAIRMFARMKPEKRERAIAAIRDAAQENGR